MYYVYELYDTYGNVVYVGESKDPKQRLYAHTKKKLQGRVNGHGRFYGQQIILNIVKGFTDRKEARQYEKQLQEQYDLPRYEDKAFRQTTLRARKLTREQVEEIKELYVPGITTLHGIAEQYGVTRNVISSIIKGHTYKKDDYGYDQ